MKSLLLFLSCVVFYSAHAQKINFLSRAGINTGTGDQKGRFKNAYGIGGGVEVAATRHQSLRWFGHADIAINGMTSQPYQFQFRNTVTHTSITYTSYVAQLGAGLRYVFRAGKTITPYTGIGAGLLLYGMQYTIEDPHEPGGCRALEHKNVQSDNAFVGRVEGGFRLATKWEVAPGRRLSFDVGTTYLRGTAATFMRLSKHGGTGEGIPYSVKFQTPSDEVHEHAIGTTYRTTVSQMMFHIGVVIPLSGAKNSTGASPYKRCERGMN